MPAPRGMSNFQGFEDPPLDVEASNWLDRIVALHSEHTGKWAKYGPYTSKKSAQNVVSHIRSDVLRNNTLTFRLQFQVAYHTGSDFWYIYIKAGEDIGLPEAGGTTKQRTESDRGEGLY